MKLVLRINLLWLVCLALLIGCHNRHVKLEKQTVKVYKEHPTGGGDDIYWYMFYYNNTWYYHPSMILLEEAEYSEVTWQSSPTAPVNTAAPGVSFVEEETVPNADLGREMEVQIDTTEQQISDMVSEGNPNSQDSFSTESSSDSSSAVDTGGGDTGGGE